MEILEDLQALLAFDTSAERAEWEDVKTANAVAVFAAGNEE